MSFLKDLLVPSITPILEIEDVKVRMDPQTWPKGYPVKIDELVLVKMLHLGFDGQDHTGELIVHHELAQELLEIFTELYNNHFPIEQMHPIYVFNNDDYLSMAANNTSAFACRTITERPEFFSQHAYGRAVDVNPGKNAYINRSTNLILPECARHCLDKDESEPGKITKNTLIYQLFKARGWDYGGDWLDIEDNHHFEKRANGEKRNPLGDSFPTIQVSKH